MTIKMEVYKMKQRTGRYHVSLSVLLTMGLFLGWHFVGVAVGAPQEEPAAHVEVEQDEHGGGCEGCDGCGAAENNCERAEHDEIAEHDEHDETAEHDEHDEHAEHDVEGDDHAAHADEAGGLRLSPEQRERFGIVVKAASAGSIKNELTLQGEIVFNEDGVVHMVPRAAGIATEIYKTLGDSVKAGEDLARIDSADLASAKLDYFAAATEVGCCQFELPRAQAIHDNVLKMLAALELSPSVEALRDTAPGEMGVYRSRLISAYAEYRLTQKNYEREHALMAKNITSEGEFLAAENAFKKAQAEYFGLRDLVTFEVKQTLREASRTRQLAEFQAEVAKQKLRMLGLPDAEISSLETASTTVADAPAAPVKPCTDPNCKGCSAHDVSASASVASRRDLGVYAIKAPFDGTIVQRHISRGERVSEESDVFTLVDTRSVWVNLTVYARDLSTIRKGQEVVLRAGKRGDQTRGTIAMVTPFVDVSTRTATARVVVDNEDGRWLPGTFVTGHIATSESNLSVVVLRSAVQSIEGRDVVFVEYEGAFEANPVKLGHMDREAVEIISGLKPGTAYVAEGAYQLKATVITSNLGSHAGHGH